MTEVEKRRNRLINLAYFAVLAALVVLLLEILLRTVVLKRLP